MVSVYTEDINRIEKEEYRIRNTEKQIDHHKDLENIRVPTEKLKRPTIEKSNQQHVVCIMKWC